MTKVDRFLRETESKKGAMIAMGLGIGNLAMFLVAAIATSDTGMGVGGVVLGWLFLFAAALSAAFLVLDAGISVIKIFKNIHPVFNTILALVILGGLPLCFVINPIGLWTTYPLTVYVLEAISIVKHVKLEREDAKKRKKNFPWFRR